MTIAPDRPGLQESMMPAHAFSDLHARCMALGTRLFTVTVQDPANNLARRAFTSHPVEYPTAAPNP